MEVMKIKDDPIWKADAMGMINEEEEAHILRQSRCNAGASMPLSQLLERRALALDTCRVIEFQELDKWHRTPRGIPGSTSASVQKCHA